MNMQIRGEILRFLIVGAANTILTYALYLALLPLTGYAAAYTIAYVAGIAIAYMLNTQLVFRARRTLASLTLFPMIYVVQYATGIAALYLAVNLFGVPERIALIASIVVTVPITFQLNRLVLKRKAPPVSGYTP